MEFAGRLGIRFDAIGRNDFAVFLHSRRRSKPKREEPPLNSVPISNELRSESTGSAGRPFRSAGILFRALESARLDAFPRWRDDNATQRAVSATNIPLWEFHLLEDRSDSHCSNRTLPFPRFPRCRQWNWHPDREDSCYQSPFPYQNRPDFWNSDRLRWLLRFEFAAQFD